MRVKRKVVGFPQRETIINDRETKGRERGGGETFLPRETEEEGKGVSRTAAD